jgi:FkbM family methyltransferase
MPRNGEVWYRDRIVHMMDSARRRLKALFALLGYRIRRMFIPRGRDPFLVQQKLIIRPQPVILDVGAYTGSVARKYRALFPDAVIHCFEPFSESFAQLSADMCGDGNMHLHQIAITDIRGTLHFHSNRSPVTNSLLTTHALASKNWGNGLLETETTVEVATTTIEDFCRENTIQTVDILKMDIQGAEFRALQGAKRMLSEQRVGLIYTEIILAPAYNEQHGLHEYLAFLADLGYDLVDIYNPVHREMKLTQIDALFISRTLAAEPVDKNRSNGILLL